MALVSDVEIRLRADIARLQQDMDRARQQVGGAMGAIGRMAGVAGAALGGIAAALTVGAFAGWIKGAIDAADAASKLSARTGVAVQDIAGMQLAFDLGGAGGEAFASSMTKLSKAITEGGGGLAALGIKTTATNGALVSNKEVMYQVADAFAKMDDGARKTSMAVDIFGKSGAELIPLLNGGAQGFRDMDEMAQKLGLTISDSTAKSAEAFNDNLDLLMMGGQGVARQIAAELLPTLSGLSGAFLESMTSGDKLKKTADFLGTGLKILFSIAVGIVEVFSTVGKTIGAAGAQIVAIMNGDFKMAAQIGREWSKDLGTSWAGTAKTITDAWSSEGNAAVEAQAKTMRVQKDLLAAQKEKEAAAKKAVQAREAAAKKAESEYAASVKSATDFIAAMQLEGSQLGKNAEQLKEMAAQRAAAKAPTQALKEQILKEAAALALATEAWALREKAAASAAAVDAEFYAKLSDGVKAIEGQITAMREQIEVYGLTETAVVDLALAKAEAALAAGPATYAELIALDKQLEKLKELRELTGQKTGLDETKKATDELAASQKSMWESIDKTAHDTFISIFDGGKGAATRLKDTFKNVFFDWLYQMTVKKWIINVGTALTPGVAAADGGGAGAGGILQSVKATYDSIKTGFAGVGSSIGQGLSTFGNSIGSNSIYSFGQGMQGYGAGGVGSGISPGAAGAGQTAGLAANYVAGAAAGIYGGRAISNGYSAFGGSGNTAVNVGTIAGAIFGGPIGAAIGGLIGGGVNRLFGHKPKEVTSTTINGAFSADSFTGTTDSAWKKKGGVFRSDKSGVDKTAVDAMAASGLTAAYDAIKKASTSYAEVLGLNATSIGTRTQAVSIALGKDEAANQKAIADFFTGVADTIAGELLPDLAKFALQGEAASATLQRLSVNFQVVDAVLITLGVTSQQVFGAVGTASIAARERLVALAGGVDVLASQMSFFADNVLTEAQKIAPVQKAVNEQLAALGYAGLTTTEQFRDAVLDLASSGKLATEAGATTYAGLLALAPAFKQVADNLVEVEAAAKATADTLVDGLRSAVGAAFNGLQRSIDAEKGALQASFDAVMTGFDDRISDSNNRMSKLQSLQSALKGATTGPATADQTGMARQMAQAQIGAVLAIARASGVLPEASALEDALRAVGGDATNQFSSLADFQRDQLRTANQIEELAALTGGQLTVEQRTLQTLIDQKTQAQLLYGAQMALLDATLAAAQQQLDAVNGVNVSVLSVAAALASFTAKAGAALANPTVSQQSGLSQSSQIEMMYQTMLGRSSDAGGMQFYLDALKTGSTMADIAGYFAASPEYKSLYTAEPQRTTTSEGSAMLTELQTLNARMAGVESAVMSTAASTGQFADQFDNATAGGGPLLTTVVPA